MKVALIGNMNNNFFAITRYLRDIGINAHLLLFNNETDHFLPHNDTFTDEYTNFTIQLNWGDLESFQNIDFEKVEDDLKTFDFLIGCGTSPAFVNKIDRKLDIFAPYGSDIYKLPFFQFVHPKRLFTYLSLSRHQRMGIKKSNYLHLDRADTKLEQLLLKMGLKNKRIQLGMPMFYHKTYTDDTIQNHFENTSLLCELNTLRTENEILLFQYCRQLWKSKPAVKWNAKGNDKLIKGFKRFITHHAEKKVKLILVEYGPDVVHTKKLIAHLNLEKFVIWLPPLKRKEIMLCLTYVDMVIGELSYSWMTYGVVYETLAMGCPLMHYRIDKNYESFYPKLYPMVSAHNDIEVENGIVSLSKDPDRLRRVGEEGKKWLFKYAIQEPIEKYRELIELKDEI